MNTNIQLYNSKLLITTDTNSSKDTIILFLPGISGGAFSERFQPLVDLSIATNYPIARMSAWEGEKFLLDKTYKQMQQIIIEGVEHLINMGYKNIIGVGKSFGGGLILSIHHQAFIKKILWAPAIGYGTDSMIHDLKDIKLNNIANLQDIKLSPDYLMSDSAKIYIIHGTADIAFPIQTSRQIIAAVKTGQIEEVVNADHSFKDTESERALINATEKFLKEC